MIRILYVNGGLMNRGGIESYMMNYYRHFDREKVQIDFVVHDAGGFGYYDEEIERMGGHVFVLPKKSTHPLGYGRRLKAILGQGDYRVIHTHMDAMGAWVLKVAKDCGIPVRIAHSHNTQHLTPNPIKLFFLEKARKSICKYATHRMACSEAAGKWLFGDETFEVVKNAIDVSRFSFDATTRLEVRKELGIKDNEFLIGHVGRFDTQKNQKFLIDVFAEVRQRFANARLVLVGGGAMQEAVCQYATNLIGGGGEIIFTGVRDDVSRLYNAFDLFVLPSLFEGLPVVAIEAQMNGCRNILSSTITSEVNISGDVRFVPLRKDNWIETISSMIEMAEQKWHSTFDINKSGYNIELEARKLQDKYIELWENN